MDISGEEAKKKWKSLKDTFRKQMKNIPATRSGDEGGAQTKPNWKFYDSLCFLRDIFMPYYFTTYGRLGNSLETFENETDDDEQSPLPTTPPLSRIFSRTDCENKKKGPTSSKSDVGDKMLEMEQRKTRCHIVHATGRTQKRRSSLLFKYASDD
ncbi:hypothetical protein GE061_009333 [Apolygus lucorum]|uniref:MADF domain-containing protein n=1 Tax=Apolygus lucorum TaxID=248454 RepID=A0A8S9XZV7_APOLU|nr:hypothetical protein GE061_009333 [Apolygus lucorum]